MRIDCEIDGLKTLRKGSLKITLHVDEEQAKKVMKYVHNFMDRPLAVEFAINAKEQLRRNRTISDDQRRKIYAILRDIALYVNGSEDPDSIKGEMKTEFGRGRFSLSDCPKELARDFIEFLIVFAFQNGIALREHPKDAFEDTEAYLAICLKHKVCAVCGREGEIDHWDHIGAGRDRTKVDDSGLRKISLCREHHSERHSIGKDSFRAKYHVFGIVWR